MTQTGSPLTLDKWEKTEQEWHLPFNNDMAAINQAWNEIVQARGGFSKLNDRIKDKERILTNLCLEAFRRMLGDSQTGADAFQDGWVDDFGDESNVDTANCVNQVYQDTERRYKADSDIFAREPLTGAPVVFNSAITEYISVCWIGTDKALIAYEDLGNSNYGTAIVATLAGTTITYGAPVVFNSAGTSRISACQIDTDKVLIAYRDEGGTGYGTAIVATVSGTTISYGNEYTFNSAATWPISACQIDTDKVLIAYRGNFSYGTAIVATVSGTTISYGNEYTFNSDTTLVISACQIDTDKALIVYRDEGSSGYGTAKVATASGTVLSFGSAAVFHSGTTDHISCTEVRDNAVIVVWQDLDDVNKKGLSRIGTISGTTVSFGSAYEVNADETYTTSVAKIADDYALIAFSNGGDGYKGTTRMAIVSGTSISFDNKRVFETWSSLYISACPMGFGKAFIGYRDDSNSSYGTAILRDSFYYITRDMCLVFNKYTAEGEPLYSRAIMVVWWPTPLVLNTELKAWASLTEKAVSAITRASSAVVTCVGHGLSVGDYVLFLDIGGMIEMIGHLGQVTAVGDVDTFTVDIDSSDFSVYTSGGLACPVEQVMLEDEGVLSWANRVLVGTEWLTDRNDQATRLAITSEPFKAIHIGEVANMLQLQP